jgi:hypothetical protein
MSAETLKFYVGQDVTIRREAYPGVIVREYLPDMYEVRIRSGVVVLPADEIRPA